MSVIQAISDFHAAREQVLLAESPFLEWTFADGSLWAEFYRTGGGYLVRFPDLADFTVSADGKEVVTYPAIGVTEQTIEHLYLNQMLPLALRKH